MSYDINDTPVRRAVPQNITDLVSSVGEDPDLLPFEKETTIRWSRVDDQADITSEEGSITRRLLRHPLFQVDEIRVYTEDSPGVWMGVSDYSGGVVTGVEGYFPIGAIKLQSGSRADSAHCKVIGKDGLVYL